MNQASERDLLCDNYVRPYIIDTRYRNSVAIRLPIVKQNVSDPSLPMDTDQSYTSCLLQLQPELLLQNNSSMITPRTDIVYL